MSRSTALWIAALAGGATIAGLTVTAELVHRGFVIDDSRADFLTIGTTATLAAALVALAIARRRSPAVGALLAVSTAALTIGAWRFSAHPIVGSIGAVAWLASPLLPLATVTVRVLPSERRFRRLAAGSSAAAGLAGIGVVASSRVDAVPGWFIPGPRATVPSHVFASLLPGGEIHHLAVAVWTAIVVTGAGSLISVLAVRWARFPRAARRNDAPVVAGGVLWTAALLTAIAFGAAVGVTRQGTVQSVADYGEVAVPFLAFAVLTTCLAWADLVRPRLGTADGVLELGRVDGGRDVTARVAELLGDPTASIVYPDGAGWIDASGHRVAVTAPTATLTRVTRAGVPLAALVHDRSDDREEVELALHLAAGAVEREHAVADARGDAERARQVAARLLTAQEAAAEQFVAGLRTGPLAILDDLATRLASDPRALDDATAVLLGVNAIVRQISHGLDPAAGT